MSFRQLFVLLLCLVGGRGFSALILDLGVSSKGSYSYMADGLPMCFDAHYTADKQIVGLTLSEGISFQLSGRTIGSAQTDPCQQYLMQIVFTNTSIIRTIYSRTDHVPPDTWISPVRNRVLAATYLYY